MFDKIVELIRDIYNNPKGAIPLHEPRFSGNEKKYLADVIDSTYVSSVGPYVDKFEKMLIEITGSKYAVATVNGTAALHISLLLAGVKNGDEVITQPLTFVATVNAISYTGAHPVFVDVDRQTLGLSPSGLTGFLDAFAEIRNDGFCYNKQTGNRIMACVPMHTFGHPAEIDRILSICKQYNITMIEDAAESIGSTYKGKHTGTFGLMGILSFNGNKTVTCGGGGVIITDDKKLAVAAKHITKTAKISDDWEYYHDKVGYNYRMPNINAALACAQLEQLNGFIQSKREIAGKYKTKFNELGVKFQEEPENSFSNYWLNAIFLNDRKERDAFLKYCFDCQIGARPAWHPVNELPMYKNCMSMNTEKTKNIYNRLVNIPSSAIL